jgi:hypothetical protein
MRLGAVAFGQQTSQAKHASSVVGILDISSIRLDLDLFTPESKERHVRVIGKLSSSGEHEIFNKRFFEDHHKRRDMPLIRSLLNSDMLSFCSGFLSAEKSREEHVHDNDGFAQLGDTYMDELVTVKHHKQRDMSFSWCHLKVRHV